MLISIYNSHVSSENTRKNVYLIAIVALFNSLAFLIPLPPRMGDISRVGKE